MIYDLKDGEYLEMLPRNKRFSVRACYGWERLSLSATILILPTREILLFTYVFHVVGSCKFQCLSKIYLLADCCLTVYMPGKA
jgi:hypothetical protein